MGGQGAEWTVDSISCPQRAHDGRAQNDGELPQGESPGRRLRQGVRRESSFHGHQGGFDECSSFVVLRKIAADSFATLRRQIFAVPKNARRAKPFVDHILNFSICDGKIWFRNYQVRPPFSSPSPLTNLLSAQILDTPPPTSSTETTSSSTDPKAVTPVEKKGKGKKVDGPKMSLTEVGPRFVLMPVKIFEGSFNGATIYENKGSFSFFSPPSLPHSVICAANEGLTIPAMTEFVPSGAIAAGQAQARAKKYKGRKGQQEERKVRQEEIDEARKEDPLEKRAVFA